MYHEQGENEYFCFTKRSHGYRSLWILWLDVSKHGEQSGFLATFELSLGKQKSRLSLLFETEETPCPGSTASGFAPKVPGSSLGSNTANCSIPNNLYPNTIKSQPQFPQLQAQNSLPPSRRQHLLGQHSDCVLAQTITTHKFQEQFSPFLLPPPRSWDAGNLH